MDRTQSQMKIYLVSWHHEVMGVMCRDVVCASTSKHVAEKAASVIIAQLEARDAGGRVVISKMPDGVISSPSPLTSGEVAEANFEIMSDLEG